MSDTIDFSSFEMAFDFLSEAVVIVDKDGKIRYLNPAFSQQLSYPVDRLLGLPVTTIQGDKQKTADNKFALANIYRTGGWQGRVYMIDGEQQEVEQLLQVDRVLNKQNLPICFILRFNSIVNEQESNGALLELAYHDELTGLANRALFNQLLAHEITQSSRNQKRFALLFVDLDGFKHVNDTLGHDAGDLLLCTIAERLEKSLRKSDVVARLGGDEFVVIMNNIIEADTVANVAEKIIRQVHKPVHSGPHILEVGCSIGIAIYPDNGKESEEIMHHADIAMYRAKQQGGSSYFYFSDELNKELQDTRKMEEQMSLGLSSSQFVPHFQPLLDQRSSEIVGIECLARWEHPEKGLMSPIEFIPVAKKVGLMHDILTQVMDKAFEQLQYWRTHFHCNVPLSVNIASNQFYQQQTFDQLSVLLKKHNLNAEAIKIEVTESTLQQKGQNLIEQLKRISHAGFSITLDDFGTGYSSLRYLQQLPVDALKIDRSFVRNIENNPHDKIIVKAIIQLAQTLGIQAVAEGVETAEQKRFLIENECFIMQGFLFSPALPGDEFNKYLQSLNL